MSNSIAEVSALKKSFGDIDAVNGLSFAIQQGETLGLLGPNGAGKRRLQGDLVTSIGGSRGCGKHRLEVMIKLWHLGKIALTFNIQPEGDTG